jgi:peptidoglycan/LPS O-acetylase OafA/YrhL
MTGQESHTRSSDQIPGLRGRNKCNGIVSTTVQAQGQLGEKQSSRFRPDIQGLRAIAVLLVVLYHSGASWLSGGYVGVDAFFVISGFLITTHLLESLERTGRINFGNFYAKRARRILPAALAVAAGTVVASWIWVPPLLMREVFLGAAATAVYVPNILFASQGTSYLRETAPSVFQHYWSLGIEEQFYLFWPAILALGFWLFKRKERALFVAVVVLTAGSFALCVLGMNLSQPWTFFSLPTRAWELGVGGLAAFLIRSPSGWVFRPATGVLAWVGLAIILVTGFVYDASTPFPGFHAVLPVMGAALLIIGGGAPGKMHAGKILRWSFLQRVGAISYSLYLVHWPLQVIPQAIAGDNNPLPLWLRLILGLLAFPLAWALYHYVEKPAMQWRTLTQGRPWKTGVAAAVASALVVVLAGTSFVAMSHAPLATSRVVSVEPLRVLPTGTSFVPANLTPTLREASSDNPAVYASGCHRSFESTDSTGCRVDFNENAPLVFLFGDSHAASWYPALASLAERGAIRLDSNTKSSCHSVDATRMLNGVEYRACDTWRAGVIERIHAERPSLVLIANYGRSQLASVAPFQVAWQDGLKRTLDKIAPVPVAVIADVPDNETTPAICLSAHVGDIGPCVLQRNELDGSTGEVEKAAASSAGSAYLDFSPYLCNQNSCPPIIDNLLVYRDAHHLTATFSRVMSGVVWEHVQPLLRATG